MELLDDLRGGYTEVREALEQIDSGGVSTG
jgi:hypothetical protein